MILNDNVWDFETQVTVTHSLFQCYPHLDNWKS